MAVTNVEQREIVEVPFVMPDGNVLPHPALVISRNELQEDEDGMFSFIKQVHFERVIAKMMDNIIG